ncbi:MAG: hypothetical protein K6G18_00990 [Treponema sp.]|nr:hypothetical protein [Treponema sp.]
MTFARIPAFLIGLFAEADQNGTVRREARLRLSAYCIKKPGGLAVYPAC